MADEIKAAGIKKFDGTDFGYWKMQIEDYLYGKKLHLPLLGSKPENMPEEIGKFLIDRFWALSDYPCREKLLTMLQKKNPLQN
jgi:hypothetical protein